MFLAATLTLGAMEEPRKSRLDEAQQADAYRLRVLWDRYRAGGGLKQDEFAAEFGLKSQSNVGHYLQGRQPLNLKSATAFARGMGVPIEAISPTIAAQVDEATPILRAAVPAPRIPSSLLELNGAEGQLIMFFRGLPQEAQAHVLTDMNNQFNEATSKKSPPSHDLGREREIPEGELLQTDTVVSGGFKHIELSIPGTSKKKGLLNDDRFSDPQQQPFERDQHAESPATPRRTRKN